jgi:two-component system nitrogen regulation sensor histidine kinase GlnL
LLSNKLKTKENQELLNIISRESDRITNIVNQVSEKQFQLSLAKENIHIVLEKLPDFINSLDGKEVNFIRDYDPSLPLVNIDSSLIMQVFYNLTRNSVEAMIKTNTGTKITVRTRVASEVIINGKFYKTACEIDFIDNGPGIPEEFIDSIFFPLVSTKKVSSGLGLAIAKGIINQHHGSIDCSSDESGTNFSILIPFPDESFKTKNAEVLNV